jgi:asparagine synthase (glutamine-hydrolysing)
MARALEPNDRFRIELHHEAGLGFGRVALPFYRNGAQPVWDETTGLGVIMEGELYNPEELRSLLPDAEKPRPEEGDAGLLLRLYRAHGEDFAIRVNGAFVAAFWDRRNRRLALMNDRLGLYPLYWAEDNGGFSFASGVRALLADPALRRRTDRLAMAQFLTFDHVLGSRTLLEDVHLLTPGSVLIWENGQVSERSYWRPIHPDYYPLRTEVAWMDDLIQHLRQAVRRQAPNGHPAGMLLSGGLDSRVILAFLAEQSEDVSLSAFTWGISDCDDVRFARALAREAGMVHHFSELRPDWLLGGADEAIRVSDGLGNIVNMHALTIAEAAGQHAQVIYKGFLGDAMFGFGLRHYHYARYEPAVWAEAHMQAFRDRGVITFDAAAREELFSDGFKATIGDGLMESFAEVLAESPSSDLSDQRIAYDFRQRVPRMTLNGVEALRGHVIARLPFAENDLVAFSLTIPPGLRYDRRLVKNAFIRAFPAYAQIPTTETGLPMMDNLTTVRIQAENWARWHLRRVAPRVRYPARRPYKDYANWFRTVLRPWLEATLLNPQALDRGDFKPEAVRRLVSEHMAGSDHTVKLGALMTLELWRSKYVDGDATRVAF